MLKYLIFNQAVKWGEFMGAKVVFSPPPPLPSFFERPCILLSQGATDLAFKNENMKKRSNMYMVSVVR